MARIESKVADVAASRGLTTISALSRASGLDRSTVRRLWKCPMPRYVKFSTVTRLCHALSAQTGELLIYHADDRLTDE